MSIISNVTVPATTANLGPGFDCVGVALTLYNQFTFRLPDEGHQEGEFKITVLGSQAPKVATDKTNLVYKAFAKFYERLRQTPPPVEITLKLGIPLARGLGSSATAIVGGLMGANQLAGSPLTIQELAQLAIAIEGHPDNVVPAMLGGCRLAVATQVDHQEAWEICEVPWDNSIIPIIAVPNFSLSTEEARTVLPLEVSRQDAIYNISRFGLLLRGLAEGKGDWLGLALDDKIHQPYRQLLVPGFQSVREAAIEAGAYGLVISGAGPSLLALTNVVKAKEVATAIMEAWKGEGITAQVRAVAIDNYGVRSSREMGL